ncbi:MAG: AAA family ATPase [Eubacteriales bacterium]
MKENLKIINLGDVPVQEVDWLWYPYIPYKKLSIIQGDPGEGKTTFILALISLLTKGEPLPEEENKREPINVIYQTAEDGLGDTIKPRLLATGADCSRVMVIDESDTNLTLMDERLEQAILKTKAKLVVLDPIQAYLGGNVDMHRANEIRPVMSHVGNIAERTGCAIVMIGHMNKGSGKSTYRGLGSIDFYASVRSVLVVGRSKENPKFRLMGQDKCNLAPEGQTIVFEILQDRSVEWHGFCEATVEDILSGGGNAETKCAKAEQMMKDVLKDGPVPSAELTKIAKEMGISSRTLDTAKRNLGVHPFRDNNIWYSQLYEVIDSGDFTSSEFTSVEVVEVDSQDQPRKDVRSQGCTEIATLP